MDVDSVFPDLVGDPDQYHKWIAAIAQKTERSLVLSPTNAQSDSFREVLENYSPQVRMLTAYDIESSLEPFLDNKPCALVLANRYDGLDLPDGVCRILVVNGLPTGTNVQEAFLEQKLGLDVLLRERIKTRITQAVGRCTRSDTDYVAVLMIGKTLLDFCAKQENRKSFHPELRAELDFSLAQDTKTLSHIGDMIDVFLKHDEEWAEFDQEITQMRNEEAVSTPFSDLLSNVVKHEVDFCYEMWAGNYSKAIETGKKVTDLLSGHKLSAYRALWYYFVATAAYSDAKNNPEQNALVLDQLDRASQACKTVSWFSNAIKSMQPQSDLASFAGELEITAAESLLDVLTDFGAGGQKFPNKVQEVNVLITSDDYKKFDLGMEELGRLLGFKSWRPKETAAPDCVWQIGNRIAFLLEGKADESPDGPVSIDSCRQASGHLNWAKSNPELSQCEELKSILVTPRERIDSNALPHAKHVFVVHTSIMRELFSKAVSLLSVIRSSMTNHINEELREKILQEMIGKAMTPQSLQATLLAHPAATLPKQ